MMTEEQVRIVKAVYSRFIESEAETWTDLDSNIELYDYLNNRELVAESEIKFNKFSKKVFRCSQHHGGDPKMHLQELCMAPIILEAVGAVISLYRETKELHPKNRYLLTFFHAMSEMKMIYND